MLISDMELPGMRGDELASHIRQTYPSLSVVLFSGYRNHQHRWGTIDPGGYMFINKPFTEKHLLNSVRTLFQEMSLIPND
ncbi:MAG: response regulator [Pontiella sp.]